MTREHILKIVAEFSENFQYAYHFRHTILVCKVVRLLEVCNMLTALAF
jgi:hypothetical protein